MAATQSPNVNPFSSPFNPTELVELGMSRLGAMLDLQKDLLGTLEGINRDWFARARSEAELTSALARKLTGVRTLPDATSACREWIDQRMHLASEDSRRLFEDGQKLIEIGARALSNGANGGGTVERPI